MEIKKYINIFTRFTVLLLLLYFISRLNFSEYKSIIKSTNIEYLIYAIIVNIACLVFVGLKARVFLKIFGLEVSYKNAVISEYIGVSVGLLTPAKVGEFIKISFYKIKNAEKNIAQLLVVFFLYRLFDVIFVFILAVISVCFLLNISFKIKYALIIFVVLIIMLIFLFFFIRRYLLEKLVKLIKSLSFWQTLVEYYLLFKPVFRKDNINRLLIFFIYQTICWSSVFLTRMFIFKAININFDYIITLQIMSIVLIGSIIPVGPLGIGSRDLSLLAIFKYFNLSKELSFIYSSLLILIDFVYIIGGIILYYSNKQE